VVNASIQRTSSDPRGTLEPCVFWWSRTNPFDRQTIETVRGAGYRVADGG
jgi:hypothetical protein